VWRQLTQSIVKRQGSAQRKDSEEATVIGEISYNPSATAGANRMPTDLEVAGALTEAELRADPELWALIADDPITRLLLTGQAATVHEAEAKYLRDNVDEVCEQVLALAESDLTDEEFSRQPLILLLRAHGSRRWEDSLR
jgi:hypothetical protein